MPAPTSTRSSRCGYLLGKDGLAHWSEVHAAAWIGLLESHRRLTRTLDAELEAEHGLTLSALEVLSRLAAAEGRRLRLSALASACGLSLSRVSRIVDALEARGIVQRRSVPGDARAVCGQLTDAGLDLARRAQRSHFAAVQREFFSHLSDEEVEGLANVFARFSAASAGCAGEAATASRP
jgi:DNA-binding MarR family transcriptional regulator